MTKNKLSLINVLALVFVSGLAVVHSKSLFGNEGLRRRQIRNDGWDLNDTYEIDELDQIDSGGGGARVEMMVKCQNGGTLVLDGDWCVCPPEFTGRNCESENDPDNINGCGTMLNNQEDTMECGKCKCTHNLLQCEAIKCNSVDALVRQYTLLDLVALMREIESFAYRVYVDELSARVNTYQVVYRDLNSNTNNSSVETTVIASSSSTSTATTYSNRTKVIVFKTSPPSRLVGLYFVQPKRQHHRLIVNSNHSNRVFSHTTRLKSDSVVFVFVVVSLFYFFLIR